jgi:hypothetical protein
MSGAEWLALAVVGWTIVGVLGLTVSLVRRERQKLGQGVGSLVGVWVIYLAALAWFSHTQPERRVAMGQSQCFHAMCFTVEQVDEVPGFPAREHERLVRLTVRLANLGKTGGQEPVQVYLRDAQGRQWQESAAVSGNPLNGKVMARSQRVSEPVFRIAPDATGLELVLTHGRWSRHMLVIGDAESLGHRPEVMVLDR